MLNPLKYKAFVSKIIKYSEDIYIVKFNINKIARFKSGQFLHLTLDHFDPTSGYWPESRVFSIASNPGSNEIEILYSVKGKYTKRMREELFEGKEVWLKLPYGDFIIERYINDNENIYMVAGGTGISPFISFLRSYKDKEIKSNIILYYGIRDKNLYLYKDLIESLREKINLNLIIGKMNIKEISNKISLDKKSKSFISGPPDMIFNFKNTLINYGYNKNDIITDDWE